MKLLKGHNDYINGLAYEPESGQLIISCSDDHTAKLWDLSTGAILHAFHLSSPGEQLAIFCSHVPMDNVAKIECSLILL